MSVSGPGGQALDRRLLGIYLNDHLAGATGGDALARRARSGVLAPEMASALDAVIPQIAEDRTRLVALMRRVGVPVRSYKVVAGRAAELVGRLKPNGHLRERSPLTDLVELDGLLMGIASKECLWRNLRDGAEGLDGVTAAELDDLIARAEAQRATLERARPAVVRQAFAGSRLGTAAEGPGGDQRSMT